MFKNMKHLITLALPVVALTFTSCGNGPKNITYQQMRRFASENYDTHALDTVPVNYIANFNTMKANAVVDYVTPTGGAETFTLGFGYDGIHATLKNRYAYSLSSTMIDMIERYYSDFISFVFDIQDEPILQMYYQLLGGNCAKVDLTTTNQITGSVLIRFLQALAAALDVLPTTFGYIPVIHNQSEIETIKNPLLKELYRRIFKMSDSAKGIITTVFGVMNYLQLTISSSSESHGDVFNTYVTTDSYGFINKLDFNFKSNFTLSGFISLKHYDKTKPEEGDRPTTIEAPYGYTIDGSFNFDFDISSQYIK